MKLIAHRGHLVSSLGGRFFLAALVGSLAACGSSSPQDSGRAGSASGGSPPSGGGAPRGGGAGEGSAPQAGGSSGHAGTMSSMAGGGSPTSGSAGSGSGAGGDGGTASGGTGATGNPSSTKFSFFITSQAALQRLSNSEEGFGGDLKFGKADGISGADEICRQLAETSLPGNGKTWRAFLSATKGPDGQAVNAIDRVGDGPWYDRRGRVVALNKAALLQERPEGADPAIGDDLPNEDGVPNHNPGTGIIDNHNVLTGSTEMGTLDAEGLTATCQDWSSSASSGGRPRCGVSWPRGGITHWISVLNESGCAPGATPPGAQSGPRGTVGGLGGYGGFYCFALSP